MNRDTQEKPVMSSEHFHGSDMQKIEEIYGIKESDIVSFSANVNPLGLPGKLRSQLPSHLDVLTSYPDREYTALRRVIGDYAGASPDHIAVGNGSSELISLYIHALAPKKALIIGPTYSEYANEVASAGGSYEYFRLREEDGFVPDLEALKAELSAGYDLFILCNPNNPTSGALTSAQLQQLLSLGIFTLVDETYVEFAEDMDRITAVPLTERFENLAVLRGVSKFFSSPGLRLGYSICSNSLIRERVTSLQVPWSINSLAEAAGRLMFTDEEFKKATRGLIFPQRQLMFDQVNAMGIYKAYPPCANFILVRILKDGITASHVFDTAILQGLMIRDCSTFEYLDESYFRFCIMSPDDNQRLLNCLKSLVQAPVQAP